MLKEMFDAKTLKALNLTDVLECPAESSRSPGLEGLPLPSCMSLLQQFLYKLSSPAWQV
jgi:hypothetical protein